MTTVAKPVDVPIIEPGVYDLPADVYHRDPVAGGSLSAHEARELLACPAIYRYNRDHSQPTRRKELDLGTAAHLALLRRGGDVVVVEADDWRTVSARQARDAAYEAGRTPILARDWERARAMATAAREHPLANALLTGGAAEQVLIWRDEETGVWCRALVDYLHPKWMVDYKTAESASLHAIRRAVATYGYHIQAEYYRDGAEALGLTRLPFFFVVQEKQPPYLVTVARLGARYEDAGQASARRAREMYRDCTEANVWPAYTAGDEIATIHPPLWFNNPDEE